MNRVNLFLIGVNKAGTSWLYHLLRQHPEIFMSEVKELYYFGTEEKGPVSQSDYHAYFPFEESYSYFGEATVMYYREAAVANALYQYNPDAQLLAIVRDPIERLRSQFLYQKQLGNLAENDRLGQVLDDGHMPRLLADSHYERTLPPFAEQFGSDQFTVVSLEEGKNNPSRTWRQLHNILDLADAPFPSADEGPENPTGGAAFRRVYRHLIPPIRHYLPTLYRWMLQSTVVRQTKLGLIRLLGTADKEPISDELRTRLQEEFSPTYQYLVELGFDHYRTP
jgi:hypothetical protein